MEIFDLYNNIGEHINKTAPRGSSLNEGEFHLVAHIWIKNNEGKYLVQKRNKQSDWVFGQYAATGGAVTTGENSLLGAQRETFEEMGIMIDLDKFKLVKRYYIKDPKASFITDLYLVKENILLSELNLEYNEVSACKYMSMDEIKELVKDDMFWDYENTYIRKGYFDLIEKSWFNENISCWRHCRNNGYESI